MGPKHCAYDSCTKMHEGGSSVSNMKDSMVICAAYVTAIIQRHLQARHVHNIKIVGINMLLDMADNHYLGFADW